MKPLNDRDQTLDLLARTFRPREQTELRQLLEKDGGYYGDILTTYLRNPFLRLSEDEREAASRIQPQAIGQLIAARDAATRSTAPKHVVFCMPKSGSSFIKSAIMSALDLPFVSLTTFGTPGASSLFGMNGREQEFDEMALARSVLTCQGGFVAQHHTRFTFFLGLQMQLFGLTPIVTVRNIFDCIVSFDDMMLQWRSERARDGWIADAQFALPADYPNLPPDQRYWLLAHSFGVWLINFHLSWRRAREKLNPPPLVIRYEDHVLDPEKLIELLGDHLKLTGEQRQRMAAFVNNPDRKLARFNVGRSGRGAERIPAEVRAFLTDYAQAFRSDLGQADLDYLLA